MSVLDHIVLNEARYDLQDTDARAMLAPTEASSTASAAHTAGSYFIYGGTLYQATADIAQGGTIITSGSGQNCEEAALGGTVSGLKSSIDILEPAANASDIGKTPIIKTVNNGKVTEYEFGNVADPEIITNAVYWEENEDDDTIEEIIKSEIKANMRFAINGHTLLLKYDGETVTSIELPDPIHCTAVELNASSASVERYKSITLVATLTPSNTTDEVEWSSSSEAVATVSNGVVTGVSKGTATITVTCGSFSDTCAIAVTAFYDDPVLGYVLPQNNRIDYQSAYNYIRGGTFNDPFLKKISSGQTIKVRRTNSPVSGGLYLYMYVYDTGTFTD